MPKIKRLLAPAMAALLLAGCDSPDIVAEYPVKDPVTGRYYRPGEQGAPTNTGGISLLDFGSSRDAGESVIGVNRHLWNASLDILSTIPLRQVDPYGGVIMTEWNIERDSPTERTRVVARISGVELEARALQVHVYRQTKDASGEWISAEVQVETIRSITDSILTRARQGRIAEVDEGQ